MNVQKTDAPRRNCQPGDSDAGRFHLRKLIGDMWDVTNENNFLVKRFKATKTLK